MSTADTALQQIGRQSDAAIDLALAALALAAADNPAAVLEPYRAHLADISVRAALTPAAGGIAARLAHLRQVLYGDFGYDGDQESYDDPRNANLMQVIDRRRGLPVALGILLIHAARAQGLHADGLNFPGHFLVRILAENQAYVLDPFRAGAELGLDDLNALVQRALGPLTELAAGHLRPAGNRDILLRLQNNLKTRALQGDDPDRAIAVLRTMVAIAPDEGRCWLELGMLEAAGERLQSAAAALRRAEALAGTPELQHEIAQQLNEIRGRLN